MSKKEEFFKERFKQALDSTYKVISQEFDNLCKKENQSEIEDYKISDLYSKEERASALGVYSMGIPFGVMAAYLVTASLIGSSTEVVDWRRIFVVLGLSGIALAILVRVIIREPKRGNMELKPATDLRQPPFKESLITLLSIPSWWAMCFGIAFGSFVAYAFSAFQTKYLILLDPSYDFKLLLIVLGILKVHENLPSNYL